MSLIQLLEPIRGAMKKQWCCVSCLSEIELDTHGRCSSCGSDAVDRIGGRALLKTVHPASGAGRFRGERLVSS
jgi:rRNA maturation endonuclease Nob1